MISLLKIICDVCRKEFEGLGLPLEIRLGTQQIYVGFLCESCLSELMQALTKENKKDTK